MLLRLADTGALQRAGHRRRHSRSKILLNRKRHCQQSGFAQNTEVLIERLFGDEVILGKDLRALTAQHGCRYCDDIKSRSFFFADSRGKISALADVSPDLGVRIGVVRCRSESIQVVDYLAVDFYRVDLRCSRPQGAHQLEASATANYQRLLRAQNPRKEFDVAASDVGPFDSDWGRQRSAALSGLVEGDSHSL